MALTKIELKLDNDKLDYVPGDTVSGHVELAVANRDLEVSCE